jgi:hypothetical protein
MTVRSKALDDQAGYIFVREKTHRSLGGKDRLMLHAAGGKGERRSQILFRELGVRFKYLAKAAAGAELAQNKLHRDPGAPDARFAHHDRRIGRNTRVVHEKSFPFPATRRLSGHCIAGRFAVTDDRVFRREDLLIHRRLQCRHNHRTALRNSAPCVIPEAPCGYPGSFKVKCSDL